MSDPQAPLRDLKPEHKFFIGIDSDGCAFDTMEPKHKECFCPVFIWKFGLAAVSKYAREAWAKSGGAVDGMESVMTPGSVA